MNFIQPYRFVFRTSVVILLSVFSFLSVQAATYTVTKIADTADGACDADCSLREAVAAANAAPTDDTIEFAAAVFGTARTITLGGTQLTVNNNGSLTINGTGAELLALSGGNAIRVLVSEGATVILNNLKITNGKVQGNGGGGGIYNNSGNVTLNNSVVTFNASATGGFSGSGGGVYNCGGTLTVNNSTFSNNQGGNNGGGGIANDATCFNGNTSSVTVANSTFTNNSTTGSGGAILGGGNLNVVGSTFSSNSALNGGAVVIGSNSNLTNVTFTSNRTTGGNGGAVLGGGMNITIDTATLNNNQAVASGGAMSFGDNSQVTINNSNFNGNRADLRGGALFNFRATVNLLNSRLSNNGSAEGGAIYNDSLSQTLTVAASTLNSNNAGKDGGAINNAGGTLVISFSTLSANVANASSSEGGGAIYNQIATVNVTNSTISNNSTGNQGGGIFNRGTVNLTNATVAFNQSVNGGGIFNFNSRTVNARNTIFARNSVTGGVSINHDFSGTLNSLGYNLVENTTGTIITGITTGNLIGADPQLLLSGDNGGATQTIGLLPTSPAIDAADPNNFPVIDQRGVPRAQDGDLNETALPDIGAYERQVFAFTVTKTADTADGACDADCSLREATAAAQASTMPDKAVVFEPSLFSAPQTITLTLGEFQINNQNGTFLIRGTGAENLTISANNQSRAVNNLIGSLAAIEHLTVADGNGNLGLGLGGGILNSGVLSIRNVIVRNCTTNAIGAGIGNNAGGLYISRSVIRNNHAPTDGGGILNFQGGSISITDSTISGNTTNGNGGGIWNGGGIGIFNSTVSGNAANQRGGGIYQSGLFVAFRLVSVTIAANTAQISGGGVFTNSQIEAFNTIIGDNSSAAANSAPDFGGNLFSLGFNLVENTTGTTNNGDSSGYLTGVDPQLLPLGNYGGATPTHALRPTSPAIDKGSNFFISGLFPVTDQRGKARPVDNPLLPNAAGGNGADIGAFERQNSDAPAGVVFDFDGDAKTDIGVFRPSDGSWWYSRSSDNAFRVFSFGTGSDVVAPGDYTGDGKYDLGVFRPSTGEWFIQRSEDNSFFSFPFGQAGDVAAPADYDNDGKTDAAVFRPSTGTWFILNSGGSGTSIVPFGASGDKPVAADFDGDGKADIAIFRPSDGSWWYLRSSDAQFRVFRFGLGTDKPVQGDYTGDGKADIAVFRPSTGEWFVQRSEDNSYFSFFWGQAGDVPAPGDFDGDGEWDAAVFRPSSTTWFINRTSAGVLITDFGAGDDLPLPGVFVP